MKFKERDRFQVEEYDLADEFRDEKRYRRNKRGKHRRDSFEGRDRDGDWY